MIGKVLHVVISVFVLFLTAGLVYKAAVGTQQAVNEANDKMFQESVNGRLLDPVGSGLTEKLTAFKTVAESLGDIYSEEGVHCYDAATTATATTAYLRAALGLQRAWITELVYIYVSYQITPGVWGDCGCEIRQSDGEVSCWFVNTNQVQLTYSSAVLAGAPYRTESNRNTYDDAYTRFAANMTIETAGQGAWQAPYVYHEPTDGTIKQLVTYTHPISFDNQTGKCTAAAQVDFTLTAANNLMNRYLPNDESHMVLYNSKGVYPESRGTFVSGTNQTQDHLAEDIWPALSSENPYPWVYSLLSTAWLQLHTAGNFLNITGSFMHGGEYTGEQVYYEAATIDEEWTVVLETPVDAYFHKVSKWNPKIGLTKEDNAKGDSMTVWSEMNTIGILGLAASITILMVINIIVGCCCAKTSKKRSADDYYMQSTM